MNYKIKYIYLLQFPRILFPSVHLSELHWQLQFKYVEGARVSTWIFSLITLFLLAPPLPKTTCWAKIGTAKAVMIKKEAVFIVVVADDELLDFQLFIV